MFLKTSREGIPVLSDLLCGMYSVRFEKPWRRILQLQREVSEAQHRELVFGGRDGENRVTLKKQSNSERKNIRRWGVHRRRLSALQEQKP